MNHNSPHCIKNVIVKEWRNTFFNLNSAALIIFLPLLITLQALFGVYMVIRFASADSLNSTLLERGLNLLQSSIPSLSSLSTIDQFQVLFYSQFPLYILLIPIMISLIFATFSIIEEKQAGALEPLLATPIRTWELLLGKATAGAVPALIITWICALVFLTGINWIGSPDILSYVLSPSWWISLFLFVPLVTILSFMLGVIASSRTDDPKSAQNMGVIIIIPLLLLIGMQVTGIIALNTFNMLIMAIIMAISNLIILKAAVYLFQRESIVIKWK